MDEFALTIRLGNEAMQTPDDIAAALHDAAVKIARLPAVSLIGVTRIRDANGNTVGDYKILTD